MYKKTKCFAIILSGGTGLRFGSDVPKTLHLLADKPIIIHSLLAFERNYCVDDVCLVVSMHGGYTVDKWIKEYGLSKLTSVVIGGDCRQKSVLNALRALEGAVLEDDIVLIHDGARPLVSDGLISSIIEAAYEESAAVPAVKVTDTIKKVCDGYIEGTVDRENLYSVQTPQGFRYGVIKKAYEEAELKGFTGTDDASLVDLPVRIVMSDSSNIKITEFGDLERANTVRPYKG